MGARRVLLVLLAMHTETSALEPRDMSNKAPYWLRPTQPPESNNERTVGYVKPNLARSCLPVSLTMLTRHGSRSADKEKYFASPIEYLEQAESASAMTPAGILALNASRSLAARLQGTTWGDLSPLGRTELTELGQRTFHRFSSLLSSPSLRAIAEATEVERTQQSRAAFIQGLGIGLGHRSSFLIESPTPPVCEAGDRGMDFSRLRFFET